MTSNLCISKSDISCSTEKNTIMKKDVSTITDLTFNSHYEEFTIGAALANYMAPQRPKTGYLEPFQITWKELTYKVLNNSKTILNNVSGSFKSGQIMAILGPSGAGKSSLLSCICGQQKKGVTGSITISTKRKVKFAFIAQNDYLHKNLTVRESLWFASRLKNRVYADHRMIVNNTIKKLMLESCADNRPKRCSGGQQKRISIALELVSRPNVLILDEPTSGLDSVTTWQLINLLIDLTQESEPMAIMLTIHQPSAKLFNLFDVIYLMSNDGQCIYSGSPLKIVSYFSEHDLDCPKFNNPSDFALEVAAKEHGVRAVMLLSTLHKMEALDMKKNHFKINLIKQNNSWTHLWLLTFRSFLTTMRDPMMLWMRIIALIICSIFISIMFGSDSGVLSGCAHDFTIGDGTNLLKKMQDNFADLFENCAGLLFMVIFGWLMAIFPVALSFPQEVNVFLKEFGNGYYSCFSYFMSKLLSDIPFQLILPNLGSIPVYIMTGQYSQQVWRVYGFAFNFILVSINASAQGFLTSVIMAESPLACAFVSILTLIPMMLLSGVMIRLDTMPFYFRYLTYFNYLRYSTESALIDVYGFDRCSAEKTLDNSTFNLMDAIPEEKMLQIMGSDKINTESLFKIIEPLMGGLNEEQNHNSLIMDFFELKDIEFFISIAALLMNFVVFRGLTYYFILRKVRSKL